jgi:hypothetical protein
MGFEHLENSDSHPDQTSDRGGNIGMAQEVEQPVMQSRRYRLKKHESEPLLLQDHALEQAPQSPSESFSRKFPEQAESYGPPILEATYPELNHSSRISAEALNEDFFAALLGGDRRLNHHVVFYQPEHQFYFFDSRLDHYAATTEEKLKTLVSQYVIRCAEQMPSEVDVKDLFVELRSEDNLKQIIKKARSL